EEWSHKPAKYAARTEAHRSLPPRLPTTKTASSTGELGDCWRPVKRRKISSSDGSRGSPMVASSTGRQLDQLSPLSTLPSNCGSLRARRSETLGFISPLAPDTPQRTAY